METKIIIVGILLLFTVFSHLFPYICLRKYARISFDRLAEIHPGFGQKLMLFFALMLAIFFVWVVLNSFLAQNFASQWLDSRIDYYIIAFMPMVHILSGFFSLSTNTYLVGREIQSLTRMNLLFVVDNSGKLQWIALSEIFMNTVIVLVCGIFFLYLNV
jgi:hypothetical protein